MKIRGYRVELGEIEAQLLAQSGVREAVVVVRGESASKRLVGYVVAGERVIEAETLKAALQRALPAFMVPSDLVVLAEMPRTPNGKVDRKRLPEPTRVENAYVAPQTEVEKTLAAIWQAVLGVARVGVTDNFFERGGDSIGSIQVVGRAREAGIRISPKEVFQHPTLQALARGAQVVQEDAGASRPVTGEVGLTPIQAVFFDQGLPEPHHYNQAVLLEVRRALEPAHLVRALGHLLTHHDALRLRYRAEAGAVVQWYAAPEEEPAERVLWVRDAADSAEVERIADEAQRSLSLETGPLVRAVYMRVADGTQRLLLVIHHLVVDGVSWRVLLEDFQRVYRQIAIGRAVALPPRAARFSAGRSSCRATLAAMCSSVRWSTGSASSRVKASLRRCGATILPRGEIDGYLGGEGGARPRAHAAAPQASAVGVSDPDQRLALDGPGSSARALERRTGRDRAGGRAWARGPVRGLDLSRTVGWFTTVYPVRLRAEADVEVTLRAIKEQLRGVPDRGLGFGVLGTWQGPSIESG